MIVDKNILANNLCLSIRSKNSKVAIASAVKTPKIVHAITPPISTNLIPTIKEIALEAMTEEATAMSEFVSHFFIRNGYVLLPNCLTNFFVC